MNNNGRDKLIYGILNQFEILVLSETQISSTCNLPAPIVESLKNVRKVKSDEKQFQKERFMQQMGIALHTENVNQSQEALDAKLQEWEKNFDEKLLFKPNLYLITQCVILFCENAHNTIVILKELCRILAQFSVTLDSAFMQQFLKKKKKQFPGKEMPKLDQEKIDETIDCYLLQTMRLCFDYFITMNPKEPIDLIPEVMDSCYSRLTLDTPYAIRYQAAMFLGSMSKVFLSSIIDFYMNKLEKMNPKKDAEVKEYAMYQQTMRTLTFSLEQAPYGINRTMQLILTKMPLVKKGSSVLYPEICATLTNLFYELLTFTNWSIKRSDITSNSIAADSKVQKLSLLPKEKLDQIFTRKEEWERYCAAAADNELQFWKIYFEIFEVLKKISSKSKHRLSCTRTMFAMFSTFPESLYQEKKGSDILDGILKLAQSSIKEKKERAAIFAAFVNFLKYCPEKYLTRDALKISNFVAVATGILFGKKIAYSDEEPKTITKFFVEYSKTNLPACCKLIEDVLHQQNNDRRVICLSSLSELAITFQEEIIQHHSTLGPLLTEILLEEKNSKEVELIKAALLCIPRVRPSSEETMKKLRKTIASYMLNTNLEIATAASLALQRSIALEPHVAFLDVLGNYVSILLKVDEIDTDCAIRLLKDLSSCLEIFIDCCDKQSIISTKIDVKTYVDMRQKIEGLSLIWMIYPKNSVRMKAVELLATVSRQDLRDLLQAPDTSAYLMDDQLKLSTYPHVDYSKVGSIAKNYRVDFESLWAGLKGMSSFHMESPAIEFTWSELIKRWSSNMIPMTDDRLIMLRHQAKLLCITIGSANSDKAAAFVHELLLLLNTKNKALNEKLHLVIIDVLSAIPEDCLRIVTNEIKKISIQRSIVKGKKKERVESSDLLFEDNILQLLEIYISDVLTSDFMFHSGDASVKEFYEQLIFNWSMKDVETTDIPGSVLNATMWKRAAHIVQLYFSRLYESCIAATKISYTTLEDEYNTRSQLILKKGVQEVIKAIYDFICLSNPIASIERVAIDTLNTIFKFAKLENPEFVLDILEYFHSVISSYRVEDYAIIDAMAALLAHNPQALNFYIPRTKVELLRRAGPVSADSHATRAAKTKSSKSFTNVSPHVKSPSVSKLSKKELQELEIQQRESQILTLKVSESIHDICACYMQAIAIVLRSKLEEWLEAKEHIISVATCLFLGLTNACTSDNPRLRYAALDLLRSLCDVPMSKLDYGSSLTFHSSDDETIFISSVLKFSAYCALRNPSLTSSLFSEADRLILDVNDFNKEIILRILEPWAYNYGLLLKASMEDNNGLVNSLPHQIISCLFNITRKLTDLVYEREQGFLMQQSSDSPSTSSVQGNVVSVPTQPMSKTGRQGLLITSANIFSVLLEKIWYQLMRSSALCDAVSKLVIDMIIGEYEFPSGKAQLSQRMLRNIVSWCARDSNSTEQIIGHLIHHLNNFSTSYPSDYLEFAIWQLRNGVDPDRESSIISETESHVFYILSQLSYEHSRSFIPFVPLLFLNSVVILNSTQTVPRREGSILLENIFQCLVIQNRDSDSYLKESIEFLKLSFRDKTGALKSDVKYSRNGNFLKEYVRFLELKHCPGLAKSVSKLALTSAIEAKDRKISLESFYVFYHLNDDYGFDTVQRLALCLFEAVRVRNADKISILLRIIDQVPEDSISQANIRRMLFKLVFFSLHSWNREHFAITLKLLLKLQQIASKYISAQDVCAEMFYSWKGISVEPIEVSIAKELFKGILAFETFNETLTMYKNLAKVFASILGENNIFLIVVLMTQFMLVSTGDLSKRDSFLEFIDTYEGKKIYEFKQIFVECSEELSTSFYATGMEQCDQCYEQKLTNFSSRFSTKYGEVFGNKHGNCVMWMLIRLLMCGSNGWIIPTMNLFVLLSPSIYTSEWTLEECLSVSYSLKQCGIDSRAILAKNAQKGLHFLQMQLSDRKELWKAEHVLSMFNFLEAIRGLEISIRAAQLVSSNEPLFIGAVPNLLNFSREQFLKAMWIQCFELSATEGDEGRIFLKMIENSISGIHKNKPIIREKTISSISASEDPHPSISEDHVSPTNDDHAAEEEKQTETSSELEKVHEDAAEIVENITEKIEESATENVKHPPERAEEAVEDTPDNTSNKSESLQPAEFNGTSTESNGTEI